ncbi:TAT-variant-translocated molybdopterin oxidoreductase [Stutzerimonas nitrititolerans]|uniref:TAT-variant-translocated molybdopterin oxidoreductase n=1 Tax=Stutzerimonas nitrititolerans TaxID=2482751 RepID=UPI00289F81D3|nr:TAT-variant-translocated molybdopterin oxidoreductase [Stutzerimonas nitrititolerans]
MTDRFDAQPQDRTPLDWKAIRERLEGERGPRYWRSLEQLADEPAFAAFVEAEFPSIAPQMDRRRFLQVMGASMAMAGLAGCGKPEQGVPYVLQPEKIIPGEAQWYATAVTFAGYAQPVLGRTHVGRPTKLEGNPDHPLSRGASTAIIQAAILQLYDPDRSQAPRFKGVDTTWDSFQLEVSRLAERLDRQRGRGLHLLLGAHSSPTLQRQLGELLQRWPEARLYRHEPFDGDHYRAAERSFGRPVETRYHFEAAEWVLSFEHDWLGAGPQELPHAVRWGERKRKAAGGEGEARLLVVESVPTLTGAKASERKRIEPEALQAYVQALAAALGEGDGPAQPLPKERQRWIEAVANALKARAGRCLVTAGECTPLTVQAAVHRLNQRLGNVGNTLTYSEPVVWLEAGGQRLGDLPALAEAIRSDQVDALLMLDCNPLDTAPADIAFVQLLDQVPLRIHAGLYYDETAAYSHWHLPLTHDLDGWHDSRAADGSVCLGQPLVRTFYSSRTLSEVLALMQGDLNPDGRAELRKTWQTLDDTAWRQALERGFITDTAFPALTVEAAPITWEAPPAPVEGLTLRFLPDPSVWDGRLANLGWLQELPKPITKLTWDNAIGIAPKLAEEYGLSNGDLVRVTLDQRVVIGPAWIMPGHAERTLSLYAGYGRTRAGRVADRLGYDLAPLRTAADPWVRRGATLEKTGEFMPLATTQPFHLPQGKDIIKSEPRDEAYQKVPTEPLYRFEQAKTLYPPTPPSEPVWGMTIDLDQCIGCNACVVACQAENNIPVVGKEQVAMGRNMHWLRVDHYYKGDPAEPESSAFQPVPCMHCEQAPCEVGCPVNATVHGPDGLNEQIYNRCIGTRTCSSYCPYKVRRFNWFDWTGDDEPSIQHQRNPNVTVRSRGVMEKCTYCVQRISGARIAARIEDRPVADGEVQTACQQSCPTQAIVFGDLSDPSARVREGRDTKRHYALLEEVGTRPKTTYLGVVELPKVVEGDP